MEQSVVVSESVWTQHPKTPFQDIHRSVLNDALLFYPTSTVWGVGCVPHKQAITRLIQLKGRDTSKPFLLIWADLDDLLAVMSEAPEHAKQFVKENAYQPVTTVMPKQWLSNSDWMPSCCISEEGKVAIRVDSMRPLLHLIQASGARAWLSSSANVAGDSTPACLTEQAPIFQQTQGPKILFEYANPLSQKASSLIDLETQTVLRS